jgi:hypothetical protein
MQNSTVEHFNFGVPEKYKINFLEQSHMPKKGEANPVTGYGRLLGCVRSAPTFSRFCINPAAVISQNN